MKNEMSQLTKGETLVEHATLLSARGLLHAAFEVLTKFLTKLPGDSREVSPDEEATAPDNGLSFDKEVWTHKEIPPASLAYDEIGKIHVQWGQLQKAEESFLKAISYSTDIDDRAKCQIHLAMTLHAQGHFDRAYRILTELLSTHGDELTDLRKGILYNNLASVQWSTQFYREAEQSMLACLQLFSQAGTHSYNGTLYNNLGISYLEMRQYDMAERFLKQGLTNTSDDLLYTLFGLSRLYFLTGNFTKSLEYAREALPLLGAVALSFQRQSLAYMSRFMGEMAHRVGQTRMAIQLMEKAELFFGLLELWGDWSEAQARLDDWANNPVTEVTEVVNASTSMMKQFLWLIEATNAQELLSPEFGQLIDTRVEYAVALADAFALPHEERDALAYAARLADYGLTALDPAVSTSPHRSPQAWEQYQEHPRLSVQMLKELELGADVYDLIACHHERMDGSGFPNGLSGGGMGLSACILQVADEYARSVVWEGLPHSEAMARLLANASAYHPDVLAALVNLFAVDKFYDEFVIC